MHSPAPHEARSVEQLRLSADTDTRYVLFWDHEPLPGGEPGPPCLSQWWPAAFEVDDVTFASAEHHMMWGKARVFGDEASAEQVLAARTPRAAKAIGRGVAGFDSATWREHRWDVVVEASVGKFGSDADLRRYLDGTGDAVLVEASPDDRIWGTGLAAEHPDARVPARWPGLNLLGFALMEARSRLRGHSGG